MSDPYAALPPIPPAAVLPHRPRQAPPSDPVQEQLRLVTQAVQALAEAVTRLSDHRRYGAPQARRAQQAVDLTHEVAVLGGWVESLLPMGVPVHTPEGWVVLE